MNIDPVTILATIVNFIILYFVLRHFLFGRINNALESRGTEISATIDRTVQDQKKAEALRIENEEKLKNASVEGKSIVESFKVKAEKVSKDIVDQASNEAQLTLERGKKELQREVEKATADIRSQVVDLAVMLSSQALGETIDELQHRKLIEEFIAKVGI